MSRKRLWLRVTDEDRERLDIIAESIGGVSRTAAVRFIIRQWFNKTGHNDTQLAKPTARS